MGVVAVLCLGVFIWMQVDSKAGARTSAAFEAFGDLLTGGGGGRYVPPDTAGTSDGSDAGQSGAGPAGGLPGATATSTLATGNAVSTLPGGTGQAPAVSSTAATGLIGTSGAAWPATSVQQQAPAVVGPTITWVAPGANAPISDVITATVGATGTAPVKMRVTLDATRGPILASGEAAVAGPLLLTFRFDPARHGDVFGLPDGIHHLIAFAWSASEATSSARLAIRVDLQRPIMRLISVTPDKGLFVGKAPKVLTVKIKVSDAAGGDVTCVGLIKSKAGKLVRRISKTHRAGAVVPLTWDGRDAKGKAQPPGMYQLSVKARDGAGHPSRYLKTWLRLLSLKRLVGGFSGSKAKEHATALAAIGIRRAGTDGERRGADFVATVLAAGGYETSRMPVPLPNGATSQNIIAIKRASKRNAPIVIIGAHMDSIDNLGRSGPGANDDGSGIGVLLETARAVAAVPMTYEIRFVAFGAEEMIDRNPDHHHAGSRAYAASLTRSERRRVAGMVNLDMLAVGGRMGVGTQSGATETFARYHLATASQLGIRATFVGHGTGSDHEAFVKLGIPVAYYDRATDPLYHSSGDTALRLSVSALNDAGRTLFGTLFRLAAQ